MSNRVLYIGGFELPDKNAAAQRVIANAKILKEICEEVILVGISKSEKQTSFLSELLNFEEVSYYNVKYPSGYIEWVRYITTIEYIVKLAEKHQITHIIAYNYPGIALKNLYRFCARKEIKLVGDCSEWYEVTSGNLVRKLVKKYDVFLRMEKVHPKLDGLIVVSDFLYDFYKSKNVENLVNVPSLVDVSMKKWNMNIEREKEKNTVKLIYAGSPGSGQKDRLDLSIIALGKVIEELNEKIIFTIVGITKSQYKESFNVLDRDMKNIDSFVEFKGRLPHTETLKQIKLSDYFVFVRDENLTTKAGFPSKYVEAISCGTPVLTNSSSSIVNFYEEGKTGFLLDNSSLDNLIASFKEVFTKNIDIQSMKDYCEKSKMFDISNFKSQFVQLLENA